MSFDDRQATAVRRVCVMGRRSSSASSDTSLPAGSQDAALPEVGRSARLAELLAELQARRITTADFARRTGVSQRSVQRDIETLRNLGHDIVEHQGREYSAPASPLLQPAEALAAYAAIRLAHQHSPALNRHYRHALNRIAASLPEQVRRTLDTSVRGDDSAYGERQMEQVAAAWVAGRVLNFDYRRPDGVRETGNELCVYFIEISRTSLTPYVIGRERRSGEVRPYKLSRMANLSLHADTYQPDPEFDPRRFLSDAWGGIGTGTTGSVRVRFVPEAAYRVMEGGWNGATLIRADGSVEMELTATLDARGLPQDLMPFLLSWGRQVEVLSPPEVRAAWLTELRETLALYAEGEN